MSDPPIYTTRRDFLTGSLSLLSTSATLPLFLGQTASVLAAPRRRERLRDDAQRILVVVQLAGGNDGLNTVIPYTHSEYYRLRPQIAIKKGDALRLTEEIGLHPAATGLKALFDDERLAIVQGVGYPNPNRSHFTSTDIWMTADPRERAKTGWLGRYFDCTCAGQTSPQPTLGIALSSEAPLALQGDEFAPLAFSDPGALAWKGPPQDARAAAVFRQLNNEDAAPPPAGDDLGAFVQRAALDALHGAAQIQSAVARHSARRGGGSLSGALDTVLKLIQADFPTRVFYVSLGGFDTHSGQLGRHQQLMRQLGDALKSFSDDLAEAKLDERVLIMTFSEFGRRVEQNASGGTDHGEAAPMLLVGKAVSAGLHGEPPNLRQLHRGDLGFTTDFRRVYASVLRDWLDVDPAKVLESRQPPLRRLIDA